MKSTPTGKPWSGYADRGASAVLESSQHVVHYGIEGRRGVTVRLGDATVDAVVSAPDNTGIEWKSAEEGDLKLGGRRRTASRLEHVQCQRPVSVLARVGLNRGPVGPHD